MASGRLTYSGQPGDLVLLEISPDPNDRRAKIVRFTDEGLKLAEVITAVNEEVESELAHVIGRKSIDTLGATLACIIDSELPPP